MGFGCGGLSGIYNKPLSHEVGSIIKETFNKGITLFDTADFYGIDHDNEIMVGKVLFWVSTSNYLITDLKMNPKLISTQLILTLRRLREWVTVYTG